MHRRKGPQSCILEGPWAGNNAVPCAYFTCIAYERLKISNDNKNRSGYCKRIHKPKFRPFPFVWRPPLRQKAQEVTLCFVMKCFSLVLGHFCQVSLTEPYLQWCRLRSSWFAPNRLDWKLFDRVAMEIWQNFWTHHWKNASLTYLTADARICINGRCISACRSLWDFSGCVLRLLLRHYLCNLILPYFDVKLLPWPKMCFKYRSSSSKGEMEV